MSLPEGPFTTKPHQVESSHEEVSSAKAESIPPIQRPSSKLETQEEGFQPSDIPFFKDERTFSNILEIPRINEQNRGSFSHPHPR